MPSTTEMLFTLGVWNRVVGVSVFCDVPPEARALPKIGSGMDPDLEQVLALEPDLVVGVIAQQGYGFVTGLEQAGVPVFLVADETLDRFYESLVELGRVVGVEEAARGEVDRIRGELVALQRETEGLPTPRVLLVFDHDPIYAAGPDTLVDALVTAAGGRNVVEWGDWVQLDTEQVLQLAPHVILEPGELSREDMLRRWASLSTVPAVRDGRIYRLDAHGLSRPGPGAPAAAREIAARLFPGRFAQDPP